jgi:2'-aminobiphenyl-2,3-diol 1,2-dioxygenase large subunit
VREFVETVRPTDERVAIVATGGLSHWICLPDSGRVNAEWDLQIIEKIISGRGAMLAELTFNSIMSDGGNGGLEIATWAFMAGATGESTGERIYYEEMIPWWTGMGGILMNVNAS